MTSEDKKEVAEIVYQVLQTVGFNFPDSPVSGSKNSSVDCTSKIPEPQPRFSGANQEQVKRAQEFAGQIEKEMIAAQKMEPELIFEIFDHWKKSFRRYFEQLHNENRMSIDDIDFKNQYLNKFIDSI